VTLPGCELTAEERLRQVTERLRAQAAALPAGAAIETEATPVPAAPADRPPEAEPVRVEAPPPHWQEAAEDRSAEVRRPARTRLALEMGEVRARSTACERLRELLGDGDWHSALELADIGGLRFGGRLFELRRGQDGGPPLDVEAQPREHAGRLVWWYRVPRRDS
jgi:hypothetical protein